MNELKQGSIIPNHKTFSSFMKWVFTALERLIRQSNPTRKLHLSFSFTSICNIDLKSLKNMEYKGAHKKIPMAQIRMLIKWLTIKPKKIIEKIKVLVDIIKDNTNEMVSMCTKQYFFIRSLESSNKAANTEISQIQETIIKECFSSVSFCGKYDNLEQQIESCRISNKGYWLSIMNYSIGWRRLQ